MAPAVLLQTPTAPSSTLRAPASSRSEHAPGKTPASKLRIMPSNTAPPPKLTSRLARAWSSATSPLTPLPSASALTDQIASSDLPPPVAARLIASVALNAPDHHYLSDLSDTFSALSVWPSVVASAVFPPSILPSDTSISSSSALFSAPSAALSLCSLSDESLSPTASTATPLEQIELGVSAGGSSRIPRTVQYSLASGETAELAFLVELGLKPKSSSKGKVVLASRHAPVSLSRPVKRPTVNETIHPLATIPLGRKNSSLGDPAFSRRRSNISIPQRPAGPRRTVSPDPPTPPPNFIDVPRFDDVAEVAAAVGVLPHTEQRPTANGHSQHITQREQEGARQQPDHEEDQGFEDLEMEIQPVAPHETKQEQAPQIPDEAPEETQQDKMQDVPVKGDSGGEEMIDLVKEEDMVEERDAKGDDVVEVAANGKEIPVRPLKDKKTPDMGQYLSLLRKERTEVGKKQIRLVPLEAGASLSGMPPAPDTAYARQGRLKERKEKGRKQADAARERKKLADARQQEKRKKLAKRKKKKAAELRGEVYVSSEEEDGGADGPKAEGNQERTNHIQDLDAEPINVDSNEHRITEAHMRTHDADPYAHQSNKRQRLNSPGSVHHRDGGSGPPFHREQRFHGNGPHGGWSEDRSQLPPNGHRDENTYGRMGHPPRNDYNREPHYPPPGPGPHAPYPVDRFHPPHPSYTQNLPHPGTPYPPPHGNVAYAPHSQYPPPPGPYPGPGYPPHGQSAPNHMYNANPQYGQPPYNRPGQAPFPAHPYYAERERLPRPVFNRKRDELYRTIGTEYEDLTPADGKAIDDFLDNQLYMFGQKEESKDYVLQRRPDTITILRIRKEDGVWSVVRLKE